MGVAVGVGTGVFVGIGVAVAVMVGVNSAVGSSAAGVPPGSLVVGTVPASGVGVAGGSGVG